MTKAGGVREGSGRKRTAGFRLMHLAAWIDQVAQEHQRPGKQRGHVKQAILELYLMQYGAWSAEDVAATGKPTPPDVGTFLRTIKSELKEGRRLLRDYQQRLDTWQRQHRTF